MTVEELKAKVETYREGLKTKSGASVLFSERGPVGMSVIDAIVSVLETQQEQIEELQTKAQQ